jgi:hypothetical protein
MTASNPVITAPLFDPAMGRKTLDLPHGLTIAQIVALASPESLLSPHQLRVVLVTAKGSAVIEFIDWHRVRPNPRVQVVLRTIPGGDAARSVLLTVVSVGALALAGPLGAALLPGLGQFGVALIGAGLTIVGSLLVNALIPVRVPDAGETRNNYSITGWRNETRPGAPVPHVFGRHRYAPPFAATSYTEIEGDTQYVRALFCVGYGPVLISDLRLGETPLSDYDDVQVEIREGRAGDAPVSLYPRQVLEEAHNIELVRPRPRDDAGEIIDGGTPIETPVTRFSAADAKYAAVLISYPSGLFKVDDEGDIQSRTVDVRIRARLNGAGAWTEVVTLSVTAKRRDSFVRRHQWTLPTRGRWQIEVTRMSAESIEVSQSDRTILAAIQSIRPEYPIAMAKPLALIALRVKATFQLNGALDDLNCIVQRESRGPVGGVWVPSTVRTPAMAYVDALTGQSNPYPATDAEIDFDTLTAWNGFCLAKGLRYDRVHDQPSSLGETLNAICAAGRATPRHDGIQWSVVIDQPQELVVDHLNPRNSSDFTWSRNYFDPPDGFRVSFLDETNEYAPAEMLIPWPGHTGEIDLTEAIELPGVTNPSQVWIEARRRMYELIHRADSFTAMQDGTIRVATRGDLVMGSFDVLDRLQVATRVTAVIGNLVELDEEVTGKVGLDYALRFRTGVTSANTIGTSTVRPVAVSTTPGRAVRLTGTGAVPRVGDTVHFGPSSKESIALRVRGIEAGEDFSAKLLLVAAAPQIDDLTDAEVPPAWDGRVGEIVSLAEISPATPSFQSISSSASGSSHTLEVLLRAGGGSTAAVTAFEVDHRPAGGAWTTVTVPVANGGCKITGYAKGANVQIRARASASGTLSGYTSTVSYIIGSGDAAVPAALDSNAISAVGSLGRTLLTFITGSDTATTRVQVYRVPAGGTLDRVTHKIGGPVSVSPNSTINTIDGDNTRSNLLLDPDFNSGAPWTSGPGWSVSGGKAAHAPGDAGDIEQGISLTVGAVYRIGITVALHTDGVLTPRFLGGTTVNGDGIITGGLQLDALTAVAGNDTFALLGDISLDAAVARAVLYRQTTACAPQGAFDYYLEPQNGGAGGVAGPVSGPFQTTVI